MDKTHVQTQYEQHRLEYDAIKMRIAGRNMPQSQQANALTNEINAKLSVLLVNVDEARNAILSQVDTSERNIVANVVGQLSQEHAQQTLILLAAIEQVAMTSAEQQQTLTELHSGLSNMQKQLPSGDTEAASQTQIALRTLEDAKVSFKHKLTVTLPIIPGILKYDREMSFDSGINLSNAYANLKQRLGFAPKDKDA